MTPEQILSTTISIQRGLSSILRTATSFVARNCKGMPLYSVFENINYLVCSVRQTEMGHYPLWSRRRIGRFRRRRRIAIFGPNPTLTPLAKSYCHLSTGYYGPYYYSQGENR